MKDEHIISILESAPLASLGESDIAAIRAHTAFCAECGRAYEAARISALLLKEHAAHVVEPSPFFQTRVLAALRERQAASEGSALRRLWRSVGALASSMAVSAALLAGLIFLAPGTQQMTESPDVASVYEPYSAEEVLLAQDDSTDEEMTYGQVLTAIYGTEEDEAR